MSYCEQPKEENPSHEFQILYRQTLEAGKSLVRYFPIFLYFHFYWNIKNKGRRAVLLGGLGFFSLSVLLLILEVFVEMFRKDLLEHLPHDNLYLQILTFGFMSIAAIALLLHHSKERKHIKTEHSILAKIWLLLQTQDQHYNDQEFTIFALKDVVFAAFAKSHATRVWLWKPDSGALRVLKGCVYPAIEDSTYVKELKDSEGIAGLVFRDQLPRYVPRLFFPFNGPLLRNISCLFPHAIRFTTQVDKELGNFDLGPPDVARNQVILSKGNVPDSLSSFVAVPLQPTNKSECLGVLCIDFKKTDPLGRDEIKMAVVFGSVLADEFARRLESSKRGL